MARVSVLTPVYNGEAYLPDCVESVLGQTYDDWDYILVDNCSRDRTPEILRDFARRDRRIRVVVNASHVGIIENHNIAFLQLGPEAEFCKVVQADDILMPNCLERFVGFCEANPSVDLVSAKRIVGETERLSPLPKDRSVFSGREIGRGYFFDEWPDIFGSPTTYFLRARAVREDPPFFNPDNLFADQEACIRVLSQGDFGFIHEVLSRSRRQPGSEYSKSAYLRVSLPAFLWALIDHGRSFLSAEEFEERLGFHLRNYYFVMARDLVNLRRGWTYWRYHIGSLRKIGFPFRPLRLLSAIPRLPGEKRRNSWFRGGPTAPAA